MSQNGPYPGQSWSHGPHDQPYTEPADPWGDSNHDHPDSGWGAHPTSMPPVIDSSGGYTPPPPTYPADALNSAPPVWGRPPPAPPPPRKRNTPIIALVVVLGLLICGGLGTAAWLITRADPKGPGAVDPIASASAAPVGGDAPDPTSSSDARFVTKGQCVRNGGSADSPEMRIVTCGSGSYEVLRRVDGKTSGEADAEAKCSSVAKYTKWYFYDSELDSLDFVLCLRER